MSTVREHEVVKLPSELVDLREDGQHGLHAGAGEESSPKRND